MKAVPAILLGVLGAVQAFAQPLCPPINFQHLAQFRTEYWHESIISGLVRQADQSFSQYVITGNPKAKTASLVEKVPNVQLSFFTCSGSILLRLRPSSVRPYALRSLRKALRYSRFPGMSLQRTPLANRWLSASLRRPCFVRRILTCAASRT